MSRFTVSYLADRATALRERIKTRDEFSSAKTEASPMEKLIEKVRRDMEKLKIQEQASRLRTSRQKPPRSYYWPQTPPSKGQETSPESPAIEQTVEATTSYPPTPNIVLTNPDSAPKSQPKVHIALMDSSKLTPVHAQRTTLGSPPNVSKPQARNRKQLKTADGREIAPKPSLFSYNICDHPRCPIKWPHERGVFRYADECVTDQEYAAASGIFGESNPPPEVWKAYREAIKEFEGNGADLEAVSKGTVDIVKGFMEAHSTLR